MNLIKSISTVSLIAGLVMSGSAYSQSCTSPGVDTVLAGTNLGTLVRMTNRSCGVSGWVCLDTTDTLDTTTANRIYAGALTVQATDAGAQVSWDPTNLNCDGRFPAVVDFRTVSQ